MASCASFVNDENSMGKKDDNHVEGMGYITKVGINIFLAPLDLSLAQRTALWIDSVAGKI